MSGPRAALKATPSQAVAASGAATRSSVLQLLATQAVPGFLRGLAQPCLRLQLQLDASVTVDAGRRAGAWATLAPLPEAGVARDPATIEAFRRAPALELLAEWLARLQASAGLTVCSGPLVEQLRPVPGASVRLEALLLVPGPSPAALSAVMAAAVSQLSALLQGASPPAAAQAQLVKTLARWAPLGTNNRHLLREAHALGMPVTPLPGGVFQFGWGRRSRLFKSSLTDSTSAVATAWSKDKGATNALLRMAGLPVPRQVAVSSLDAALKAAQTMGYPVVLKPVNLDQGLGVEADLRDEGELRLAHARSARHGSPLVLEQHVPGEDYRVYAVHGEMLGVAHRVPARVSGDGVATVAQLVAAANAQRRQAGQATVYKPVELDQEALDLLAREGLTPLSVVPAGRVLTLRRSANSSRGGTSVDVTQQAHPDNVALCVQAAALLRLDVAGLDLLMPDIARSWREVGAAFCEVNAQPQMGGAHPWLFERILSRLVVGRGRIPAVLLLTQAADEGPGSALARALQGPGCPSAVALGHGTELIERCRALVMRPDLGAIVVQTDGSGLARLGLPLDRFDVLVVSGWRPRAPEMQHTLALLAAQVEATALVDVGPAGDEGAGRACQAVLARMLGPKRVLAVPGAQALPDALHTVVQGLPDGG